MKCVKCNKKLDDESNYCPYCGEKQTNKSKIIYKEDIKHTKIEYMEEPERHIKNDKIILGLILGIASIPTTIFNVALGLPLAIISFILVIIGYKSASKGLNIASLIITIITFIISIIISIFIIVGSIKITLSNGYKTTIKNFLIDALYCEYYEDKLIGYWLDEDGEIIYLDKVNNYYIYLNEEDITDNYYYGSYYIYNGVKLNDNETQYSDDNYYYYKITSSENYSKLSGEVSTNTLELIKNGFTLKLNKKNKNNLVLEDIKTNTTIELNRKN